MSEDVKVKKPLPKVNGKLRAKNLHIPEIIWKAPGIVVMGRRIKSVIFTTDIAIIRNCNADAVLAVYPFTPQQIISQSIITAASIPVFAGVGGGTTQGFRAVVMAKDAEAHGAYGVVVNSPMSNENIRLISKVVDIPIIVTVVSHTTDIASRIEAGATILNVSAGPNTPEIVRGIREKYPDLPIIATGGPTEESIKATIDAGANTISYTPPSTADIFTGMMEKYRHEVEDHHVQEQGNTDLSKMLELL